jgi:hypothetical protein
MSQNEKKLGKISKVSFGLNDREHIGILFSLQGKGWGVNSWWGFYSGERSEESKWTESDRNTEIGIIVMRIADLLHQAKVQTIDQLQGVPIEVTFDGNLLNSWRVLEEVI